MVNVDFIKCLWSVLFVFCGVALVAEAKVRAVHDLEGAGNLK